MIKPTAIKAFGLGLVAIFPIISLRQFSETEYLVKLGISFAILIYIVLWLILVHGPAKWEKFRWVPVDPIGKVLIRGASWVAGIGVSIIAFKITDAS